MYIILINPPRIIPQVADYPPLGLAFIEASISQDGHKVTILDAASWSWSKLKKTLKQESPDIIGITCWTIERGQAFKTAKIAKEYNHNALIIMGGPHATAFPEHMFIKAPVDYVVLGEGEVTMRELLRAIGDGSNVSSVKGIAYKNEEDIIRTEQRSLIQDLDSIPLLNHNQFDYLKYNGLVDCDRKTAAIMTSRGCPYRCSFCSSAFYWGRKYRTRSIDNVMKEIEMLYYEQDIRALLIFDDNLLVAKKRCIELCKALIAKNLDLIWVAEGSVNVDAELLGWMKKAGCYRIDFGVESGSPTILKNINKPFSVDDTRNAFKLCKEAGIKPNAYLIFGSPGETTQTIRETITLMRDIQPDCGRGRSGIWILPNTEIYNLSKMQGIISDSTWLQTDNTLYYTGEHSLSELKRLEHLFYFTMLRNQNYIKYIAELIMQWFPAIINYKLRSLYKSINKASP